jgi:hypothetical protein
VDRYPDFWHVALIRIKAGTPAHKCGELEVVSEALTSAQVLHSPDEMDPEPRLQHNAIVPEHPCSGDVIEREEFSMGQVRVAICSACGTEFQYVPDSDWLN